MKLKTNGRMNEWTDRDGMESRKIERKKESRLLPSSFVRLCLFSLGLQHYSCFLRLANGGVSLFVGHHVINKDTKKESTRHCRSRVQPIRYVQWFIFLIADCEPDVTGNIPNDEENTWKIITALFAEELISIDGNKGRHAKKMLRTNKNIAVVTKAVMK